MSEEIGRLVVKSYRSNKQSSLIVRIIKTRFPDCGFYAPPPPSLKKGHIVLHLLVGRSVDPICLKFAKLCTVDALREQMIPIDFQVTWSKVQVKLLVFEKMSARYLFSGGSRHFTTGGGGPFKSGVCFGAPSHIPYLFIARVVK